MINLQKEITTNLIKLGFRWDARENREDIYKHKERDIFVHVLMNGVRHSAYMLCVVVPGREDIESFVDLFETMNAVTVASLIRSMVNEVWNELEIEQDFVNVRFKTKSDAIMGTKWEDIEIGMTCKESLLKDVIAGIEADPKDIIELRWNYAGSYQGHYKWFQSLADRMHNSFVKWTVDTQFKINGKMEYVHTRYDSIVLTNRFDFETDLFIVTVKSHLSFDLTITSSESKDLIQKLDAAMDLIVLGVSS